MDIGYAHKKFPAATVSLIVINSLLYVAGFESSRTPLYLFSHAATYHLLINMLVLWVFGSYLEARLGWKRLLLYFGISALGSEVLWKVVTAEPLSGASGAISGLMGLYFSRCHFSKKKAVIPVRLIVVNVDMHAGWFLYYWFLWHEYSPLYVEYNAIYCGGFFTGIIIGMLSRHRAEDRVRDLLDRAVASMEEHTGLAGAEEALLEAHGLAPETPGVNLALGRYYANSVDRETRKRGRKFYLEAARGYALKKRERGRAGEVFLEYFMKYREPVEAGTHLKYASMLSGTCNYEGAVMVLEPFIEKHASARKLAERIFLAYIDSSMKAGFRERAQSASETFEKAFPGTVRLKEAEALLRASPPAVRKIQLKLSPSANTWEGAARSVVEDINLITSDIKRTEMWDSDFLFWDALFLLLLFSPLFVMLLGSSSAIAIIIFLPFAASMARRAVMSFFGGIYAGRGPKTEEEGLREFNLGFFMDKARACEREGKFHDAIAYLRGVLAEDGKNIYARYRIAWLYHRKLHKAPEAAREYGKVLAEAPEGHPLRRDAREGIRELSRAHPQDKQST